MKGKYHRLRERALSASVDYGRLTIYAFDRFCRHCGKGMVLSNPGEPRRLKKALWQRSMCSDSCADKGPRVNEVQKISPADHGGLHKRSDLVEELAFVGVEIKREEELLNPMARLVGVAQRSFRYLSEKLRFLEIETKERWIPSKYYYYVSKPKSQI